MATQTSVSPRPLSYGEYYKNPTRNVFTGGDSAATSSTANTTTQNTPQTQTQVLQTSASPKTFTGGGSTNYSSSYTDNLKSNNYQSFLDMLKANQNKYIGASLASQPRTNYVETNAPLADGTSQTSTSSSPTPSTGGQTALATVQKSMDAISKAQQNLSRNEYEQDIADWEAQGKYWFNPNANLKPDIEKYMAGMPSSIESLKNGSWVDSLQSGNSDTVGEIGFGNFLNPASIKVKNDTASAILNPLNILEQKGWVDEGQVNYIGAKAAEGGMSGGFIGAAIGIIDGIFSWNSAKEEDAKRKAKAQAEYEQKLKEWTYNTNKRLADANATRGKEIEAKQVSSIAQKKSEAAKKKSQKISDIAAARKEIATSLMNAGSISQKNRETRLNRWRS